MHELAQRVLAREGAGPRLRRWRGGGRSGRQATPESVTRIPVLCLSRGRVTPAMCRRVAVTGAWSRGAESGRGGQPAVGWRQTSWCTGVGATRTLGLEVPRGRGDAATGRRTIQRTSHGTGAAGQHGTRGSPGSGSGVKLGERWARTLPRRASVCEDSRNGTARAFWKPHAAPGRRRVRTAPVFPVSADVHTPVPAACDRA